MPEATDEMLARLVDNEWYRVEGFRITADARYLGRVGISHAHATFHAGGFSGELSPDSRFVIRKHATRVFIVFRQFDSSRYHASPADHVAGWVPAEDEATAQNWVDRINVQIRDFDVR